MEGEGRVEGRGKDVEGRGKGVEGKGVKGWLKGRSEQLRM